MCVFVCERERETNIHYHYFCLKLQHEASSGAPGILKSPSIMKEMPGYSQE